jgi:type II secretory pathway pseudopilin PulG
MKIPGKENSGITLLEISVVILIIAVLAALIMPALSRSREQAKATLCANNMRQLLAGRQSYVVENDGGTIPKQATWSGANCTWRWYLNQKYKIPAKVFKCPSAPSASQESANDLVSNYAALGDPPWDSSVSVARIEHGTQQLVLLETRGTSCVLTQNDTKGSRQWQTGKELSGSGTITKRPVDTPTGILS